MVPVLSLGDMPLANALLSVDALDRPERRYPLDVVFCSACALMQITETVPPQELFSEYGYFSSFSDTMLAHARELVARLIEARALGPGSLVIEPASNDGYLLRYYRQRNIPVLGIEPARNVARVAIEERGVPTLSEFFGLELAQQLVRDGRRADVLHANNVLAHVADLNGFVAAVRRVLKESGVAVVEVPYLGEMVARCEFDTIYHEHLCYFSLTALANLFQRHDLAITDVERLAIHGGSLRVFAEPGNTRPVCNAVTALLDEESRAGMRDPAYFQGFARRVTQLRAELLALLRGLRSQGKRIAAYGAAAKGAVLLNYCGVAADEIEFVVDRSTHKQGKLMPGVHLPVCAPARLLEEQPDYVLLLAWNLADEILDQQAEYRARGGKFIVPVPAARIV